jgi:hypothetical protein
MIVEYMLALPAVINDPISLARWTQLKTLLANTGADGTSSDEEENGGMSYKVHAMPWRNPVVTQWLDFIDARYWKARSRQGPTLRRRNRDETNPTTSQRDHQINLPAWFYDPTFDIPVSDMTQSVDDFSMSELGLDAVEGLPLDHPSRFRT